MEETRKITKQAQTGFLENTKTGYDLKEIKLPTVCRLSPAPLQTRLQGLDRSSHTIQLANHAECIFYGKLLSQSQRENNSGGGSEEKQLPAQPLPAKSSPTSGPNYAMWPADHICLYD